MLKMILKSAALLLAGVSFAGTAGATQSLLEDFSYSTGDLTTVSTGVWAVHSGGTTSPVQVTGTSLAYSGITGQTGGSATTVTLGQDINRALTTTITGSGAGETAYASVILNVTAQLSAGTGEYSFMMIANSGATNFIGKLYIKNGVTAGTYQLGLVYNSSATSLVYDATERPVGTPVFVVIKLTSVAGATNDKAELFINPVIGAAEPASNVTATYVAASADVDWTTIDKVAFRQATAASNTAPATWDTIRVGTTWADVTGASVPVTMSGFTAE